MSWCGLKGLWYVVCRWLIPICRGPHDDLIELWDPVLWMLCSCSCYLVFWFVLYIALESLYLWLQMCRMCYVHWCVSSVILVHDFDIHKRISQVDSQLCWYSYAPVETRWWFWWFELLWLLWCNSRFLWIFFDHFLCIDGSYWLSCALLKIFLVWWCSSCYTIFLVVVACCGWSRCDCWRCCMFVVLIWV